MKQSQIVMTAGAFILAIASAFTTKPTSKFTGTAVDGYYIPSGGSCTKSVSCFINGTGATCTAVIDGSTVTLNQTKTGSTCVSHQLFTHS